jgi:hypothetical protein
MASQSHRICVADSTSSRHLLQVGSSVNPSLKRCALRWQCCVNSPISHLNWSLFSFNRSFIVLAEDPCLVPSTVWVQLWLPSIFCDFCLFSPWPLSRQLQLRRRKWFRSCERMFRSCSCQLNCNFITHDILMTWHPYQLNPVIFDQLCEGLVAVPDQLWGDLVIAKCFNCNLIVWWNIDVPIFIHSFYLDS